MSTARFGRLAAGGARRALASARPQRQQPQTRSAHTVMLMRHGESTWNLENKFTGWYDCPLSAKGHEEAAAAGKLVAAEGLTFDVAYTSVLTRAIQTLDHALFETGQSWIPVVKAWQLNERHYGALQGLDKKETVAIHGKEQVNVWRRSYDVPPPALELTSSHYPGNDARYKYLDDASLPTTESLAITAARVIPFWQQTIVPELKAGKSVLIAAHGNSLRALVQYLDHIPNDVIAELNIPTATPLLYQLDEHMAPMPYSEAIAPLQGKYLGYLDAIRARIEGVKKQTG